MTWYGKDYQSDRHANPTTNLNPNPYLVAVRYGSLAHDMIRSDLTYLKNVTEASLV